MKKFGILLFCGIMAAALAGCGIMAPTTSTTINPNYASPNPDLMSIGMDAPTEKPSEILNLGSYCVSITEKWKRDGKTPDGQSIWTKDHLRKVVPCR